MMPSFLSWCGSIRLPDRVRGVFRSLVSTACLPILFVGAVGCIGPREGATDVIEARAGVWADAAAAQKAKPSAALPPVRQPAESIPSGQILTRAGLVVDVSVVVAGKEKIAERGRRISETGTLTLPIVGTLAVVDLSLDGLKDALTKSYREYFVDPLVIVELARDERSEGTSPWGHVTVLGRVKRPGRVNIPPTRDLTLSMAIQLAGGYDTSAKDSGILVTRRCPDGSTTTREFNLNAVGSRGRVENDVALSPGDVVYVPVLYF
jgi:polysaccharide export outer membrane protein